METRSFLVPLLVGAFLVLFLLLTTFRTSSSFSSTGTSSSSSITGSGYATTTRPAAYAANQGSKVLHIDIASPVKSIDARYFAALIDEAKSTKRKRKMTDLTLDPPTNMMQTLLNTWIEKSYSPVHRHLEYSENFVVLDGALAFFTFALDGSQATCHMLSNEGQGERAIIVEKGQFHAMTAAPSWLGYPGHAVIFEMSGHMYDAGKPTKQLATWAPSLNDGLDGDEDYYQNKLLTLCKRKGEA